jgi:hypothetical protein
MVAAMTSTCTHACKFIDYGVRFFLKYLMALTEDVEEFVQTL